MKKIQNKNVQLFCDLFCLDIWGETRRLMSGVFLSHFDYLRYEYQPLIKIRMRKFSIVERKDVPKRSSTVAKSQICTHPDESLRFFVGCGNNSELIKRLLSNRTNWSEVDSSKQSFLNLRWQQSNKNYKYQNCIENHVFRQSLSHFQYHYQLSNKEYLFKNLYEYCQNHKINIFSFVPLTFILNVVQSTFQQQQIFFVNFYNKNKPSDNKIFEEIHLRRRRVNPNHLLNLSLKTGGQYCKYDIHPPYTSQNSPYLWILKPTFYNRGNGIHVFSRLQELQNLMNKYMQGVTPGGTQQTAKFLPQVKVHKSFRIRQAKDLNLFVIRSNSFVVQKYMEKPLLFSGRKFDIRMWVLFTHQMKVLLFKNGYMRTSSYEYKLSYQQLGDLNIHLTNNAVQKYNQNYGRYQLGNQLSFDHLRELVESRDRSFEQLMLKIKDIVKLTALSVRKKINKQERTYCFQIFGYDFMLDEDCNPWLIEVNTNPCIQDSSPVLHELLPRMLDDAFSLTIDKIFDSHRRNQTAYPVQRESNSQNLWQLVVDLKRYS